MVGLHITRTIGIKITFGTLAKQRYRLFSDYYLLTRFCLIIRGAVHLDVSLNLISDIGKLPDKLEWLDLSSNSIKDIGELPSSITGINLSWNKEIKDLTPVTNLLIKGLRIDNNRDTENSIGKIYIKETSIENPPSHILAEDDYDIIIKYLQDFEKEKGDTEYLLEAKVLVVGEPATGKTTLAKRIIDSNAELPTYSKSTENIEIEEWEDEFPIGDFSKTEVTPFKVNLWDFGGQEIYYRTHQFFFNKNAFFLLLADSRRQNPDFNYWLNTISRISGKESNVFIIINEIGMYRPPNYQTKSSE